MKRKHLLAFYCTLLLPIGAIVGAGVGSITDLQVLLTLFGAGLGAASSYLLWRSTTPNETP